MRYITVCLLGLMTVGCGNKYNSFSSDIVEKKSHWSTPQPRTGNLTEKEMDMARIAWKYFENNYQESTGLVNAVNNYPSVTWWDASSYLAGMVSALELGIIEKEEFDHRFLRFVTTLNTLDLFRGELPNKAYNTQTAAKVDYGNQPGEIGYSALDLGRLLIWLYIIKNRYPEYATGIDSALLRWNYCNVVDENGTMFGALLEKDKPVQYLQEGRLGYEEYAAKGFELWGFNTTQAAMPEPYSTINLYGYDIPYDTRDPRKLKAHSYVVTESYVLDGIELGWDLVSDRSAHNKSYSHDWMAEFALQIYRVQEERYKQTGIITARTEHQLAGPPYFVYDTIYTDGFAWNTISETGEFLPQYSAVAVKGAMGMWALWDTEYTDLLFDHISHLYDREKGFYEGIFENGTGLINTFTSNNNGITMEILLYKQQGKLLTYKDNVAPSLWEKTLETPFGYEGQCLPRKPTARP
ncbi:DUF3131 domain-containing protein [Photobacterium profundum]|uniref:DUF3131 domain-containing protein n=1 Tax=Photobacterium profundum 3TCK TaxID=314280 RepID=Q1Z566_9GAMM|nr:DUF3131 domain-containing protein [Photobacterium profundum]EAS43700.1 hypothetical protein P3TCK_18012 [Photobacterium profundum 3TCK]PSV64124.1 DUF3131 domain-containing protein [Photobacterium profundum]